MTRNISFISMFRRERRSMKRKMRDSILIYGSGTMGCGIACCAALAKNDVLLYDIQPVSLEMARNRIEANLSELAANGLCSEEQKSDAITRIQPVQDLDSAFPRVKLVIEAVFENLELKQDVFQMLDAKLPVEVPILSNTSGLRISDIAAKTSHPERTLTTHFWLPAHLIPLVEVVVGDHSSPDLAAEIKTMLSSWGKSPVLVNKDLPGQLANRILQAVIREASNIVDMGLASAEDVDTSIKMGMALRFPVWGPLEHVDAVGMELCRSVQNTVLPVISASQKASPIFDRFVSEGRLGSKSGAGFYDWSKKSMPELEQRRNEFIIYALKKIREHK